MRDMRLTIPSTDVVREELDKYNYEDWSEVVQAYLIAHGLWDVVEPGNSTEAAYETKNINTAPEVETSKPNYDYNWKEDKRNAAALHAIKISCGPKALSAIRGIHSAQEAWRILAEKFKPPCYIKFEGFKEEYREAEYDEFFEAVETNQWDKVKGLYTRNRNLLKARFKRGNRTALHYAVFHRENVGIVKDMIENMSTEDLKMKESVGGCTALLIATGTGSVDMVKSLADRNPDLLGIASNADCMPVEMALCYGDIDMTRYLYDATKQQGILSLGKYWANFITRCISWRTPEMLDMASELLDAEQSLAIAKDRTGKTPLYILACSPFLFADGLELRFFKQWIYDFIISERPAIAAKNNRESAQLAEDLEYMGSPTDRSQIGPPRWSDMTTNNKSALDPFRGLVSKLLKLSGLLDHEHIQEMKMVHERSLHLLRKMCRVLEFITDERTLKDGLVYDALLAAVDRGNIKFLDEIAFRVPELCASKDEHSKNLFMRAIESRQAKLFRNMLGCYGGNLYVSAASSIGDKFGNNLLHIAGRLAPSTYLNRIPGAALQMQRELQWFKEVQKIVHPATLSAENSDNMTPSEVFTKSHKDLLVEGEKWMKDTTTSCIVVAALVVNMVFASAFTIPEEKDTISGRLRNTLIISDATSLFYSTASVFVFLGILTSRYEEDDFLQSLPVKLMIGLSTLFVSIVTMLIAFCAIILIELPGSWARFSVILLAALPVTLFAIMQFHLLIVMFKSTYFKSFTLTEEEKITTHPTKKVN